MLRLRIPRTLLLFSLAAGAMQNPVMPGDHPDPSVIRVGDDYWAASTSSEWAPVFPLFVSHDLRHWTQKGAVFPDPPGWAAANFWAPELTNDNGAIRVYYAARKRNGPLCVAVATAAQPEGPYTDRGPLLCQEDGAIDPFFTHDENGTPYLIWKEDSNSINQPSTILAQPLTEDGLHVTGTPHALLRSDAPWEGKVVEGPDILRHEGFFYLLYAGGGCCGSGCDYAVGVARAKSLLGPWEKDPANPIVAGNSDWKCPGHGTAVSGPDGNDYFLYHAYARRAFVFTGRESVLDRITWRNGWPAIDAGHGPASATASEPPPVHEDFQQNRLQPGWEWPLHDRPEMKTGGGALVLTPRQSRAGGFFGVVVARVIESGAYSAETVVIADPGAPDAVAGLAIMGDPGNAAGVALRGGRVVQWRIDKGNWTKLAEHAAPAGAKVRLRIQGRNAAQFRTWFAGEGGAWTEVGKELRVGPVAPWDRGLRAALFAGGGKAAQFTSFDLTYGK